MGAPRGTPTGAARKRAKVVDYEGMDSEMADTIRPVEKVAVNRNRAGQGLNPGKPLSDAETKRQIGIRKGQNAALRRRKSGG